MDEIDASKLKADLEQFAAFTNTYGTSLENQMKSINKMTRSSTVSTQDAIAQLKRFKETIDEAAYEQELLTAAQKEALDQAQAAGTQTEQGIQLTKKANKLELEANHIRQNAKIALENYTKAMDEASSKAMGAGLVAALGKALSVAGNAILDTSKMAQVAIKGLQTSRDSIKVANDVYMAEIERNANIAKDTAGAVSGLGASIPFAGAAISLAGDAAGKAAAAVVSLTKDGIDILNTELVKTRDQFNEANAAGAFFTGGMTEMRNAAGAAGLRLDEYSKVIEKSGASLRLFGGSQASAMKQVGEVVSAMAPEVSESLRKLGYTQEDIAAGSADYMATLAFSGSLAGKGQKALATESASYLTNLKLINAITGEDAKAAKQRSDDAARQAAVFNALSDIGGNATAAFKGAIEVMPGFEKSFQQALTGGPITDQAVILSPAHDIIMEAVAMVRTGTASAADVVATIQRNIEKQGPAILAANKNLNAAALGAMYGQGGELAEGMGKNVALVLQSQKSVDKIAQEMAGQARSVAKGGDALLDSSNALATSADAAAVALESRLTPALDGFTKDLSSTMKSVDKWVDLKLKAIVSSEGAGPLAAMSAKATDSAKARPTSSSEYSPEDPESALILGRDPYSGAKAESNTGFFSSFRNFFSSDSKSGAVTTPAKSAINTSMPSRSGPVVPKAGTTAAQPEATKNTTTATTQKNAQTSAVVPKTVDVTVKPEVKQPAPVDVTVKAKPPAPVDVTVKPEVKQPAPVDVTVKAKPPTPVDVKVHPEVKQPGPVAVDVKVKPEVKQPAPVDVAVKAKPPAPVDVTVKPEVKPLAPLDVAVNPLAPINIAPVIAHPEPVSVRITPEVKQPAPVAVTVQPLAPINIDPVVAQPAPVNVAVNPVVTAPDPITVKPVVSVDAVRVTPDVTVAPLNVTPTVTVDPISVKPVVLSPDPVTIAPNVLVAPVKLSPEITVDPVSVKPTIIQPDPVKLEQAIVKPLEKPAPAPRIIEKPVVQQQTRKEKPNKNQFPAELADANLKMDIKAAKEYVQASLEEKSTIRSVTGLTDKQLLDLNKQFGENTNSAIRQYAAQISDQYVDSVEQLGIPKTLKELNISATIPDGKSIPLDINDNKIFNDILEVLKTKQNEKAPTQAPLPEFNIAKLVDKLDEHSGILRAQVDLNRQVLDKLDKANAINRDILSYAR